MRRAVRPECGVIGGNIIEMKLESARLLLREFREDDYESTHAYACDPKVTQFTIFGPNSEQDTREFLLRAVAEQQEDPRTPYGMAIELKDTSRHIGAIGMRVQKGAAGNFGYVLHKDYWGKGYMPEAARALLTFAFQELKLHRMIATCDPANISSIRVLEKLGMRREGHFIQDDWIKGRWRDSYLYAILAEEWKP